MHRRIMPKAEEDLPLPASVLTMMRPFSSLLLGVSFQEVVHSALTEEAEVAEASDSEGRTEWIPIRMRL